MMFGGGGEKMGTQGHKLSCWSNYAVFSAWILSGTKKAIMIQYVNCFQFQLTISRTGTSSIWDMLRSSSVSSNRSRRFNLLLRIFDNLFLLEKELIR
jgi:hypothetical protein